MYSPVKAPAVVLDVEKRSAPAEECTTGDILQQPALVMRWIDRYTLLPNLQNPRSYTKRQKGLIVFVVSLASFSAPFSSNVLLPAFPEIQESLHMDDTSIALTSTLFLIANGLSPIWHAFLSEKFGRRPVYLYGFAVFTMATVLCALSPNAGCLIGFRFLQACGSACAQSVGIGTISDIYVREERGRATGWWYLGPVMGPLVAPIVAGAIYDWLGWRAILWFLSIMGGLLLIFEIFCLPETSNGLKTRQAALVANPPPPLTHLEPRSFSTKIQAFFHGVFVYTLEPLGALAFIRFPPVGLTILVASCCFGCLFAISTAIPFVYSRQPYHFNTLQVSLTFIPACIGYMIGSVLGGYLSDHFVARAKRMYGEDYPLEARLLSAWVGIPFVPLGLLLFGWAIRHRLQWFIPLLGAFFYGLGIMLTTGTMMAYFADAIPGRSASVVACYNLVRNGVGGFLAAITPLALKEARAGWYCTILAIMCILVSVNLEVVQVLGPMWRRQRAEREARRQL